MHINDKLIFRSYDFGFFAYEPETMIEHSFNHSAEFIIKQLLLELKEEEIIQNFSDSFAVSYDIAKNDYFALIQSLIESGIVVTSQDKSPSHYKISRKTNEPTLSSVSIKAGENGQLISVLIELTYKCNLKCIHCYADKKDYCKELSANKWKQIIDELYDLKVMFLSFSGGEAYLKNEFFEILEYASLKGFVIDVFSNGTLYTKEDIKKMYDLNIRMLHVSLYSSDAKIHDSITQTEGSFQKSLSTIFFAKKTGLNVNIKSVLMKENQTEARKLRNLTDNIGVSLQTGLSVSPTYSDNMKPIQHRITNFDVLHNIFAVCLPPECTERKDGDKSICGAGFNSLSINPFGEIFPCNAITKSCGHVDDGIGEVWKHSDFLSFLRCITFSDIPKCRKCKIRDYCQFCIGVAISEKDKIEPYSEACTLAKAKKLFYNKKYKRL